MATKKEIKEILKTLNLTEADMDTYWNDLIETNWKVKQINRCGKTWRDMSESVIRTLPEQKQKDIEAAEQKKREEEEKEAAELKAKQERDYYDSHFEEIIVNKIDNGETLTEKELQRLVWDCEEVDRDEGENRRWSRTVSSILLISGRYFCLDWEEGLTECQENEYYNQPYEVEKKTYEKTITVTEWVSKN